MELGVRNPEPQQSAVQKQYKTMMMTDPEPYKEWNTMHPNSRWVLKRLKPQKKMGAEKTFHLKKKSLETSKELGAEKP